MISDRLSACIAVVPYREQPGVKSRLASELSPAQRLQLARAMLSHVLGRLLAASGIASIVLVGDATPPAHLAQEPRIQHLATGASLNDSVILACQHAVQRGAGEVLIAHADLPTLSADFVSLVLATGRALAGQRRAVIVSCPAADGTNLLWLTPASPIAFAYGKGSRERHFHVLAEAGYAIAELPAIRDVDSREDLAALRIAVPDQSS